MTGTDIVEKRGAPGPRNTGTMEPSCLFLDETEIAHCVLGSRRARMWPGLAAVLERHGQPKIDVMYGGRYWPAVRTFIDRAQGLVVEGSAPVASYSRRRARARGA